MKAITYKDHPIWKRIKRFVTVTNDRVLLESFGQRIFEIDLDTNTLYSYRYERANKNRLETLHRQSSFADLARIFWLKENYNVVFVKVSE